MRMRCAGSLFRRSRVPSPRSRHLLSDTAFSPSLRHWALVHGTHRLCLCSVGSSHRLYSTGSDPQKSFAVLGGGITGLATAKYLSDAFPKSKVTIFEQTTRPGGWVSSHQVDTGDGEVIFETGPRSLRPNVPNGTLALRLIEEIGLTESLLVTSRFEAAARNRFIYYPNRLVRLPGPGQSLWENISSAWSSGLFSGIPSALAALDLTDMPGLPEDESVGSYLSKRIGEAAANNVASAGLHGIYGGDVWQLSARSVLSWLWEQEKRQSSILSALSETFRKKQTWTFADDMQLQMLLQEGAWSDIIAEKFQFASVYTFKRGVQELPDKLSQWLSKRDNVEISLNSNIRNVARESADGSDSMKVSFQTHQKQQQRSFDHVISTLPSKTLRRLLTDEQVKKVPSLNILSATHAVTVAVINLYFRTPQLLTKVKLPRPPLYNQALKGFGYLIPNSVPFSENPERALGVIFDSDVTPDLWTSVPAEKIGTRLTVMMGGHWWDGWKDFPSEQECIDMARSVLQRHLGISEAPAAAKSTLQRDCIPQYTVGHTARMTQAHGALRDAFGGRLSVTGSWYNGVGVNDCLRAAFEVAHGLKTRGRVTGLERFDEGRPMALVRKGVPGVVEVVHMEEKARGLTYAGWKS